MSTSNEDAGAGCGAIVGFILLACAVLYGTNPSLGDHKAVLAKKLPKIERNLSYMRWVGYADWEYHDCYLFSYVTCKVADQDIPLPVSTGFLGQVFCIDEDEHKR
jgi:hypothetical protein